MSASNRSYVVWRFTDNKPGHENQSQGLIKALSELLPIEVFTLQSQPFPVSVLNYILRKFPEGNKLPDPDLIIGAGHQTHMSLLMARSLRGGRVVVLMKPSLPLSWFDFCVIPEHDKPGARDNVFISNGVLNQIESTSNKDTGKGLILIGGPSTHYSWDESGLLTQLGQLVSNKEITWHLTGSRRTPESTIKQLQALCSDERLIFFRWQDTDRQWLPDQLKQAATVWVTEDSVSMIYEALTSGAACGLLEIPRKGISRVSSGVDKQVERGLLTTFAQWKNGKQLTRPDRTFNEAQRCARWLKERWLSNH